MKKGRNGGKAENKSYGCKLPRNKGVISLSSEEKENYESDTEDNTDPDQADNKYLL